MGRCENEFIATNSQFLLQMHYPQYRDAAYRLHGARLEVFNADNTRVTISITLSDGTYYDSFSIPRDALADYIARGKVSV